MENNNNFNYTYSASQQAEIKKIRDKYLPKEKKIDKMEQLRALDRSVERAGTVIALIVGILGTLIMGAGMSAVMVGDSSLFTVGIVVGIVGIAILSVAYPLYKVVVDHRRKKIAPVILKLTEELQK